MIIEFYSTKIKYLFYFSNQNYTNDDQIYEFKLYTY